MNEQKESYWQEILAAVGASSIGVFVIALVVHLSVRSCEADELTSQVQSLKLQLASAQAAPSGPAPATAPPARIDTTEIDRCDMSGGVPVPGHRWGVVCVKSASVEWRSHYQERP
jgi:hypothetical protein